MIIVQLRTYAFIEIIINIKDIPFRTFAKTKMRRD